MLNIRHEQDAAFRPVLFEKRLPDLVLRVRQYLIDIRVLTGESARDKDDLIRALLVKGYGFGFRKFDSLAQYVAYWFILGEGWDTGGAIPAILAESTSEEEKWAKISSLLPEE